MTPQPEARSGKREGPDQIPRLGSEGLEDPGGDVQEKDRGDEDEGEDDDDVGVAVGSESGTGDWRSGEFRTV